MIFNMVGGGAGGAGGGATLVVSSPANVSVTVSKDDKSYTKNSGDLGSTTFKGLSTGTWTVTIEGNGQTATKTILITADYSVTIAFFTATITITYPANSNCVVTDNGGTTVASDSNSTAETKTFTATVNAVGTYTITATATDGSGETDSKTVIITTEGQSVSVTLVYWDGTLYDAGNEYSNITGGWDAYGIYMDNSIHTGGTVTKNAGNMVVSASNNGICASFPNKVKVSDYSKLNVTITSNSFIGGRAILFIASDRTTNVATLNLGKDHDGGLTGTLTLEFDPSALTGEYYIGVGGRAVLGTSYSMTITKVWLS